MENLDSKIYCGEDGRWHVVFEGKESSKSYDHAPEAQKALREMRVLDSKPVLAESKTVLTEEVVEEWVDE